jgi:hypothetical protein
MLVEFNMNFQTGWSRGITLDLYSVGALFDSWLGHQI